MYKIFIICTIVYLLSAKEQIKKVTVTHIFFLSWHDFRKTILMLELKDK